MSGLYKTIKKQGLKGEDKARFAKALMQTVSDIATRSKKKMKKLYEKIRKESPSKQGKHIKQMLKMMIKIFGEDETKTIAESKLEELQRPQGKTEAQSNAVATTVETVASDQNAMQIAPLEALPNIPQSQMIGSITINAQNSTVIAPSYAGNNGNINTGVNGLPNMLFRALSDNPSDVVSDEPMTCSSEVIQAVKDDIILRIINTWEFEGMKLSQTEAVDLNNFYTEIYIIGNDFSQVNNNHEIWQVETAHMSKASGGAVIKYHDIFKPGVGGRELVKNVLTKGIAGIGKTITVKKYIRDWAERKNKLDTVFDFVFLFPFRDLNKYNQTKRDCSLLELLCFFYPELKKLDSAVLFERHLLLIFDGLDESDFPLAATNPTITDEKKIASLDVLLTSLMRGKLLPSARLWITTRPAAATQLPEEILTQGYVSQIQGFNDQQKEEFLRKHIEDEEKAKMIISHLKSSKSLYIMCHVPLFCWMSACVLTSCDGGGEWSLLPRSLTEMYIHFLITQTGFSHKKYKGDPQARSECLEQHKGIILKLGSLAFKYLEKPQIYFNKKDLRECGIEVGEALKCPGLCAELLKMDCGLYAEEAYCFIHLSIQEFLAALYAFHEFAANNHNALGHFKPKSGKLSNLADFLNSAVDKLLNSNNGHLDLFTRFLFGISLDSSRKFLEGFLPDLESSSVFHKKVVQHIKALRRKNLCPDRCFNLVHCLVELHDNSFLKELEHHKNSIAKKPLSPFQCSALAYQAVRSEEDLLVLDLRQYRVTEDCYLRFTPAIPFYKTVLLNCIGITKAFSPTLASALCVPNAQLTELDLSYNFLQSGMMFLSRGLCSPNCKIKTLNLSHNRLNSFDVEVIRDVLMCSHSKLENLDLSNNDFQKFAMDVLCAGLRYSRLTVLRLSGCCISSAGCQSLAKALGYPQSCQKDLDLSYNNPGDLGKDLLLQLKNSPNCTLDTVKLSGCCISSAGCQSLVKALGSTQSCLKDLDLSYNNPGDLGKDLLLQLKNSPNCTLDTVNVDYAGECREKPLLHKYYVDLMLDLETANEYLHMTDTNKWMVKRQNEKQLYGNHPKRFDQCNQVLCTEGLRGRHYWEVGKSGPEVHVGVAYESIVRKGASKDVLLGRNNASWSFLWSNEKSAVSHNDITEPISTPHSFKIGIFLDWPAGTLSFYRITGGMKELEEPIHLYTFHTAFIEPVYPAFRIQNPGTSIFLSDSN